MWGAIPCPHSCIDPGPDVYSYSPGFSYAAYACLQFRTRTYFLFLGLLRGAGIISGRNADPIKFSDFKSEALKSKLLKFFDLRAVRSSIL